MEVDTVEKKPDTYRVQATVPGALGRIILDIERKIGHKTSTIVTNILQKELPNYLEQFLTKK